MYGCADQESSQELVLTLLVRLGLTSQLLLHVAEPSQQLASTFNTQANPPGTYLLTTLSIPSHPLFNTSIFGPYETLTK